MPDEAPRLIIDTDWKAQAQAEKERLAAQAAAKPAAKAPTPAQVGSSPTPAADPAAPNAEPDPDADPAAPVSFRDLVGLIATQAMSYMGFFPDPQTGQAMVSLEYAKLHIDMLGILEDKTKNNLTPEEDKFLAKTLGQLRMEFVEISKAVAKAVQEGRVRPVAAGGSRVPVGPGASPGAGAPPGISGFKP